jgi:hypothetical protein
LPERDEARITGEKVPHLGERKIDGEEKHHQNPIARSPVRKADQGKQEKDDSIESA